MSELEPLERMAFDLRASVSTCAACWPALLVRASSSTGADRCQPGERTRESASQRSEPLIEFHAEAGAPEGALYLDGKLVGWIAGDQPAMIELAIARSRGAEFRSRLRCI